MAGVNKAIIMGNLGSDPKLSTTQGGMAVCKFSIATSKRKKDGTDVTSWHRCTAFGRTAETIAQYVGKGQQLYIEGELSYGQYEKDGQTHYTTDIFVNEFAFVGSAKQGDKQPQPQYQQQYQAPPQQQYQQPQQRQQYNYPPQQQFSVTTDPGFYQPPKDDSIPF